MGQPGRVPPPWQAGSWCLLQVVDPATLIVGCAFKSGPGAGPLPVPLQEIATHWHQAAQPEHGLTPDTPPIPIPSDPSKPIASALYSSWARAAARQAQSKIPLTLCRRSAIGAPGLAISIRPHAGPANPALPGLPVPHPARRALHLAQSRPQWRFTGCDWQPTWHL